MKEAETISQLDNIQINFEPAKVAFSDFGAFEAGIEQAIAKYGTFDLEVNTIEEVKQARTDLNKLSENLEKRRKEIKGKSVQSALQQIKRLDRHLETTD